MSSSSVPVSLFPVEPSAEIRRYREGKIKLRVSMWHYSALRAKPAGTATEGGIGWNNTRKLTHLGRAFLQFADPNHRFFLRRTQRLGHTIWHAMPWSRVGPSTSRAFRWKRPAFQHLWWFVSLADEHHGRLPANVGIGPPQIHLNIATEIGQLGFQPLSSLLGEMLVAADVLTNLKTQNAPITRR